MIILIFKIIDTKSMDIANDDIAKGFKMSGWICSSGVPQMCLKNKVVTPMDFKTTIEVCQNKIMWDGEPLVDGVSLFTFMVTKSELDKCNEIFRKILLNQLVIDSFEQYSQSLITDSKDSDELTKTLSKMNLDFSFSNVGKLGLLSASYDFIPSVNGVIGESVCGNADLKSWSLSDVDCKLSTCGNVHVGLDGDLNLKKDYAGDSTSISISIGALTIGVSFSISESKLVLRKPTIQVCWDVLSLNWFKVIKEFLNTNKMGLVFKKIFKVIIDNKDAINTAKTVSDQKSKLMDLLKMTNAGANVCKAKFHKPKDLIIERSNNILIAGDSLKDTVIDLMKLAVSTIRANLSMKKKNGKMDKLTPMALA